MSYPLEFKVPCNYPSELERWINYYKQMTAIKMTVLLVEELEGQTFVTIGIDEAYSYIYLIASMYGFNINKKNYNMENIKEFVVHNHPKSGKLIVECQCDDEDDADELPQLVQRFNEVYGTDFWVSHRYDDDGICFAHVSSNHLAPENVFFLGLYVAFNKKAHTQEMVYKP